MAKVELSFGDESCRLLYRTAFYATLAMLVIIPLQILVYSLTPIPGPPREWFLLLAEKPLVGLFHTDFFLLVNNLLIVLIYLAFYHSLKDLNEGAMQTALALGLIGVAAYISSNKTFELFRLSADYAALAGSQSAAEEQILLAAGKVMLLEWQGTGFDVYYVLNGIALLIFSLVMRRAEAYGKSTALIGLVAGVFMAVPSTAGTVGLVFSLLSLIPWYLFAIRFCLVFRRLGWEWGGRVR